MKRLLSYFLVSLALTIHLSAQVESSPYAGSMKKIVGEKYVDSKSIPGLKGWMFRESSMVTEANDPAPVAVDVYQKGTTYVVFFSVKEDSAIKEFTVADLVEIKNVTKSQQIKTVLCREHKKQNEFIIALTGTGNAHYYKAIKAWRFNRDRIRFEKIDAKTVDCLNEGEE